MKLSDIVNQARARFPHEEKIVVGVSSGGKVAHLGYDLDQTFRAGPCLQRLLAEDNAPGHPGGEWYLVAIRPDGRKRRFEKEAAARVLAAARLIDFPLQVAILAVKGRTPVVIWTGLSDEAARLLGMMP